MDTTREECMIAVCGPVDAGKSSLIGVLTSGELDDGRGFARNKILIHKHEQDSGRTSNITFNPLVYESDKNYIYLCYPFHNKKHILKIPFRNKQVLAEENSTYKSKIISFIDLAGHEKYLKTTIKGVAGSFPDYGVVVIGANTGITRLTREHIGILFYLKIPIIIIITKIDLAPRHVYRKLCNRLKKLLSKKSFGKVIYFISDSEKRDEETNIYLDKMIGNPDIIPIISISNKNGININNLHKIFYNLPNVGKWKNDKITGSIIYLDKIYNVPGIGLVVSGTTKGDNIKVKQKLYIGPFNGHFKEVIVRSIHNSIRQDIKQIVGGVQGCFAIKPTKTKEVLTKKNIRNGMVLIHSIDIWKKNIVRIFWAKITVLHHTTTIKTGYTPVIHCGPIRQSASIILGEEKQLRSGDNCVVQFKFTYHSEFLEKNMIFFFRDGKTKGVGEVIDLS